MIFICGQCGQKIKPVKVTEYYHKYYGSIDSTAYFEHCGKKDKFSERLFKELKPSDYDYTVVVCKETLDELCKRLEWI